MTSAVAAGHPGLTLRWRTLEWWGCGIALFLQTGAVFPLLVMGADGTLDDSARATLRLVALPAYLISLVLLARHPKSLLALLRNNLPLVFLLALPFLSVAWSVSPSVSLRRAVGLLLSMLLAYVLAMRFTPRQLMVLVALVLGICMALSLALMVMAPGLARMPQEADLRGVFLHKNVLGWYATLSALVSSLVAFDRTSTLRRWGLVLLIASIACLALSGSATALVSAISAASLVGFYVALARLRGLRRVLLVLVFLQLVVLLMISMRELLVPILEALGRDATLTGRVPLWALVDDRIANRPLLGYGYQAFWTPANSEAWRVWAAIGWMAPHSHNGIRETMLSLGAVGTVTLVIVVARGLRQGAMLHCRAPRDGWLWLNVMVGAFLGMNLTESLYLSQNDFLFIVFATALVSFSRHARAL